MSQDSKRYRELEKEAVGLRLPVPIVSAIRVASAQSRKSNSHVVSEAVARHLGVDFEQLGFKPRKTRSATSVAS